MSFDQFKLDPVCLRILKQQGMTTPTPVQAQAIPAALEGRDILAISQTGTGKTFAFGLPALTSLDVKTQPWRNRILVLTPTRELAHQVHGVLKPYADAMGLKSVCLYGGVGMEPQVRALRNGVSIVIATPGRLIDHMDRRNIKFNHLSTLVLDEADRMLDMGFMPSIKRILENMPEEKQTMLFSATFPPEIERLTAQFLKDPFRIQVAATNKPSTAVRQNIYTVVSDGKLGLLKQLLEGPEMESAIVFLRTKVRTDRVSQALHKAGIKSQAIHGDRSQRQRQQAIDGFRKGHYRVLVATDVAARGLDVQGITHVVNYDIPMSFDDYIHRIGRTARASAEGDAITFVSPNEHKELYEIESNLGNAIPQMAWEGAVEMTPPPRSGSGSRPSAKRSSGPRKPSGNGSRNFRGGDNRKAQDSRGGGNGPRPSRDGGDRRPRAEAQGEGRGYSPRAEAPAGRPDTRRTPQDGERSRSAAGPKKPYAKGPKKGGSERYGQDAARSKSARPKKNFTPGSRGPVRSRQPQG